MGACHGWRRWALADPTTAGLWAVAVLLAVAWLDPGWSARRAQHDMIAVLDVTQSMLVADMPVPEAGAEAPPISRLARSRQLLLQALPSLPCGSRLGLAIFTEYRSLLLLAPMEVCDNYRELKTTLASLESRMAWSGNSEVAKGLYGALKASASLPSRPAVVFFTDGHEAPPVNPRHRPVFDGEPGEVAGLLVGVGGDQALPIPRQDPSGRPIGTWGAGDVLQVDPRSLGRGGSQGGERMVEEGGTVAPMPGATPGREHLSALRERLSEAAGARVAPGLSPAAHGGGTAGGAAGAGIGARGGLAPLTALAGGAAGPGPAAGDAAATGLALACRQQPAGPGLIQAGPMPPRAARPHR